jgi:hypothetical protein
VPHNGLIDGWVIPAGTVVFLSTASANRDDAVFEEAARFDITCASSLAHSQRCASMATSTGGPGTGISGPTILPLAFDPT